MEAMDEMETTDIEDHMHCLICFSDLTTRGKTPCNHNDICGRCHLRMRHLHDDNKCPICKTPNETIIVDSDQQKPYEDYPIWGDELGAGFLFREDVGMHFASAYYESEILPLFGYGCLVCSFAADEGPTAKKAPIKILQEHLRKEHRMSLCNLCVEHKRDFVTCLPRFTPSQVQNHLKNGDGPESGFKGHPLCEFCKPKRFYDLAALHQHLHKEHYECHVCKKQGLENQFFKNYKSLEKHFDSQHFLCHHPNCLAARFMVFENEIDLRAHEMQVHGASSTGSTKITVEFQTRRVGYDGSGVGEQQDVPSDSDFNYGLDGQAFVPDALPRTSNGRTELHPQHVQRTEELKAQAAVMREQQAARDQEESFPTLQAATGQSSSSAPLVGWASDSTVQRLQGNRKKNAGKVTEEDFPTLPTAPGAKANPTKNAIRGNVGATRRQFAAMQTSGATPSYGTAAARLRAPASTPGFAAGPRTTSLNQQANLSADNFPSLGGVTRPAPYAAANAYAKRNNQKAQVNFPSLNSASDFPSMPIAKQTSTKQAPSLSNMADFPSPPQSAGSAKKKSVRDKMLGSSNVSSSPHQAMNNVLQMPSKSAEATIEDMKASMGQKKFKELKRMTREFADGQLAPEGYVDQSAALFSKGYDDADFWSYLPSLIESCPNDLVAQRALSYMTSLKQKEQSNLVRNGNAPEAPSSSWGGARTSNNILKPPSQATNVAAPSMRPATIPNHSTKNNAWGAAGKSAAAKTIPSPGSVASAAASHGPRGGGAPKSMANQQKNKGPAQQQQQGQSGGKKKNKKKERDELRALAFGI